MTSLTSQIAAIVVEYGTALPPIEVRRQLWAAVAAARNQELEEARAFTNDHGHEMNATVLAEIGRILDEVLTQ